MTWREVFRSEPWYRWALWIAAFVVLAIFGAVLASSGKHRSESRRVVASATLGTDLVQDHQFDSASIWVGDSCIGTSMVVYRLPGNVGRPFDYELHPDTK